MVQSLYFTSSWIKWNNTPILSSKILISPNSKNKLLVKNLNKLETVLNQTKISAKNTNNLLIKDKPKYKLKLKPILSHSLKKMDTSTNLMAERNNRSIMDNALHKAFLWWLALSFNSSCKEIPKTISSQY